ncbi:MAG: SUMF1/EgtB/PvdO family nonheme iron enzyme [Kiritimatiellia bacterium]
MRIIKLQMQGFRGLFIACALFFSSGMGWGGTESEKELKPLISSTSAVKHKVVDNLEDLLSRYREVRQRSFAILPPDPFNPVLLSGGFLVVNEKGFHGLIEKLTMASINGGVVYPLLLAEDSVTREIIIFDAYGSELERIPSASDYDPYEWVDFRFSRIFSVNANPELKAWYRSQYDPSRVMVLFYLYSQRESEFISESHRFALGNQPILQNMMMGDDSIVATTNLMIFSVEALSNGNRLGVTWPSTYTSAVEILSCTNYDEIGWLPVSSILEVQNTNRLWWTDTTATGLVTRFYLAANALLDSDNDGLNDARERRIYGTNPTNFDSDDDTLPDGWELLYELNPTNAADGTLDTDSDGLCNADEYVYGTDPNSRVLIKWGDPMLTEGSDYHYPGPDWWTGATKNGGQWLTNAPFGWNGHAVGSTADMGMEWIPAGTNSGVDYDTQSNYCLVVSNFFMDRTEISRQTWRAVRSWALTNGYNDLPLGYGKSGVHPVYSNNWYDCVKWCNARSEMEGYPPAYYTTAEKTNVYRNGQISIQDNCVNWTEGYRLPTDVEWEYAARGGTSSARFPWVSSTIKHSRANYNSTTNFVYDNSPTRGYHPSYCSNGVPYTSPVGSFAACGYGEGLYDMIGNVFEWTWNQFNASRRTLRGGSWYSPADVCRISSKRGKVSEDSSDIIGFRTVLCKDTVEELVIGVNRAILSVNVVMSMNFQDTTNSSLYIGLADSNHRLIVPNLFGNVMTGSGGASNITVDIPFSEYANATEIHLWVYNGFVTIYTNQLYIDQDHDSVDADLENQFGTSDNDGDTDGDGFSDYNEIFTKKTDPTNADVAKPIVTITNPSNNGYWVLMP